MIVILAEDDGGSEAEDDGGSEPEESPDDPAESEVPQSKINARSEAKRRKRSTLQKIKSGLIFFRLYHKIPLTTITPIFYNFSNEIPDSANSPINIRKRKRKRKYY